MRRASGAAAVYFFASVYDTDWLVWSQSMRRKCQTGFSHALAEHAMKLLIVAEEPQTAVALSEHNQERRDAVSRDERGASRDGRVFAPSSAAPTVGCGQ